MNGNFLAAMVQQAAIGGLLWLILVIVIIILVLGFIFGRGSWF